MNDNEQHLKTLTERRDRLAYDVAYAEPSTSRNNAKAEHDALSFAILVLERSRWVAVEEKEPEEGQSVAFIVAKCVGLYDYENGMILGGHYSMGYFNVPGSSYRASHWMALPEWTVKGD